MIPGLAERLADVDARITDACRAAGRQRAEITRIVVTKFHPAQLIRDLVTLGVTDVGENRHQEASAKFAELADLASLRWHFIGQLQSNKARQVARYATVVHSIDRPALANAFGDAPVLDCFVQVNLTDDPGRGGAAPSELDALAECVAAAPGLNLLGVMAVAPLEVDPRRAFAEVRQHAERVRAVVPSATALSMGMSHDFEDAILEGATHLRIGSAITGERVLRG
ncbi:MAG TPA: YggS family pyridoxal phosphate-dependent enzyme [Candidatus Lumbricidophila sp.]|nr:YggS family pyridoxal phosphate-dependent enzyme [Candidatus Lumbricidophila sp.]